MRFLGVLIVLFTFVGCFAEGTLPSNKQFTSFSFRAAQNPTLSTDITATVSGSTITCNVPTGTDITHLIATFDAQADHVTVNGVTQVSGVTANDFTSPVTYEVVAADGTKQSVVVTVDIAASSTKEITAFSFRAADNSNLTSDVTATINGTLITATVPFGTNVTALKATFTTTGTSVRVGSTTQVSGTTPNNFTNPVTYTVVGADNSTKNYTVTLTISTSSAKDITAFSFLMANNSGLTSDVTATITGTTITATVPYGTNVTALKATFTTTGASVKVGSTVQSSGTTANDFTNNVTYVVTAADNTTKSYTVTVTIADGTAKDITAFSFKAADNPDLTADVTGTITGTAIAVTVPAGVDVTDLIATFTTTGASVKVGSTTQTSGMTSNNFTLPVTYTVTALDNSTKDYTVTVTVTIVNCDALTNPTNGMVSVTNLGVYPSTATYSCNIGYAVNGARSQTCGTDGHWSSTPPTCDATMMVMRVGDGSAALMSAATAAFIEVRRITDGALVDKDDAGLAANPIALPTATNPLTLSGTATSEGNLSLATNGKYVTFAGYAATPGTTSITSSTTINRVVGRIDGTGMLDVSTRLATAFAGSNVRGACTTDGTVFWVVGNASNNANAGIQYAALGATTATQVLATPPNTRMCGIFGNQLYESSQSANALGVSSVGTGVPTTTGATATLIAGTTGQGFAILDTDGDNAVDTMYVAGTSAPSGGANTLNVEKWLLVQGTWTKQTFTPALTGSASTAGLAAVRDGSTTRVLATTGDGRVVAFDDTSATPAVTVLVPSVMNTSVRGVARSPFVAP